jgi:predicted adenine nucleotide alpha hydrolase (AANH) superfamily ATPase
MIIYGSILPGAASLANWAARTNITEKAKQNTYVEVSHLSDENEFYRQGNVGCDVKSMQKNWVSLEVRLPN